MNSIYSQLSASEVEQLIKNGNYSNDWSRVKVKRPFNVQCLRNNEFYGDICIGLFEEAFVDCSGIMLPQGISGCIIKDSVIGDYSILRNVKYLSSYQIGEHCKLINIDEVVSDVNSQSSIESINECGGRKIKVFSAMRLSDAYLWAKYRDYHHLMQRLDDFTKNHLYQIGDYCEIRNCKALRNVTVNSSQQAPSKIENCVVLSHGVVGYGCVVESGCIVERFLLGENVHLERGLRLTDSVVGDNSTLACCEVGNSMIFPAHEQHHNNSFLIATLIKGQSNVAAGCTIGSNHNGRTADNELVAGRGFWPGLCSSLKHSSMFSSYCLLSKSDYPYELDIKLPFSLVNNNITKNQLEVMPAYWWMYNMYALDRNSRKFAARDKRKYAYQHIEFSPLAPDTIEEIIKGYELLEQWISKAEGGEVVGEGMENSRRRCVILKPQESLKAYEDMMIYYAMQQLGGDKPCYDSCRETQWVNLGGQLIKSSDFNTLVSDIEDGKISSWEEVHQRYDQLWSCYPQDKQEHAYHVLCYICKTNRLSDSQWDEMNSRYCQICEYVQKQVRITREKDAHNVFRQMTYNSLEEMTSVLGD